MTLFWITFATGFGFGLALAMPVGPIALICIQQTLSRGLGAGVAAGVGVALADAAYAAVAAFGLVAATVFLTGVQTPLRILGLAVMLWLAWRIWRRADTPRHLGGAPPAAALTIAIQTFVLTLTNPLTIMTFLALFVGAGVGLTLSPLTAAILVAGAFAGSMLWWVLLAALINAVRVRLEESALAWINRVSALMIAGFAVWLALNLIYGW
jgi:putative LysE/RhtB family amino acid efflux pump